MYNVFLCPKLYRTRPNGSINCLNGREWLWPVEPCANVVSATARRSVLIGGGDTPLVQKKSAAAQALKLEFRILVSKVLQQRTPVIKVCMLNNYFCRSQASNWKKY